MATHTKTVEVRVDDMDERTEEGVMEVSFAVDRSEYVMDLSEKNRERLHKALAPFVAKARVKGSVGSNGTRPRKATTAKKTTARKPRGRGRKADPAKVREWAVKNGIEVGAKGRVPAHVTEAFLAAKSGAAVSAPTPTREEPPKTIDTTTVTTRTDPTKVKAKPPVKKAATRKRAAKKATASKAAAPAPVAPPVEDAGTEGVAADRE